MPINPYLYWAAPVSLLTLHTVGQMVSTLSGESEGKATLLTVKEKKCLSCCPPLLIVYYGGR